MRSAFFGILLFIGMSGLCFAVEESIVAKEEVAALREAIEKDRTAADAFVLYPEAIRNAIFEVSQHPEAIVKVSEVQMRARASFRKFLEPVPEQDRAECFDLARYPGLIDQLVDANRSQDRIVKLVPGYPKEVGVAALKWGVDPDRYQILVNIYHLNHSIQEVVGSLLAGYPEPVREAFNTLFEHPEILNALHEHMDLTVLLGSVYKKDPTFARARATERHEAVLKQSQTALQDWKTELEGNPEAVRELEAGATLYASQHGSDPKTALAAPAKKQSEEMVPYSYWFGSSVSDDESQANPFPAYYDWGFYVLPDGGAMITGLPSYRFVGWLLNRPENLEQYPYLADLFLTHYEKHPETADSFTKAVSEWIQVQGKQAPQRWMQKDANRPARLREYARLSREAEALNLDAAKKQEYVEVRADKYPGLNFALTTPTQSAQTHDPSKTIRIMDPTEGYFMYRALDYQISSTGRPHRSGQIFSTSVPVAD